MKRGRYVRVRPSVRPTARQAGRHEYAACNPVSIIPSSVLISYHDCVHHMLRRRRPRGGWPTPPPPQRRRLTSGILTLKFDFFTGLAGGGEGEREALAETERGAVQWQLAAESVESSRQAAGSDHEPRTCHLGDLDIVGLPPCVVEPRSRPTGR